MAYKSIYNFLYLFLLIPFVSCEKFRFDNYTLYKILPKNDQDYKILQDLQNTDLRYDFWTDPAPQVDFVNIMSSPKDRADLEKLLDSNKIDYVITMKNIQQAIDKETVKSYTRSNLRTMEWNAYYNLSHIEAWLDDMAAAYPNVATIVSAGKSYEGRDLKGIKISHGPGRRVIFIESGIHAREWITPSCACYMINELLTNNDPTTKAAAEDYDWYIFPVTNPDGYVWSHEQFRMWRKNRRPNGQFVGVDLNRNWHSNWLVVGASSNPASDTYAGLGPFSEPETRSLSTFIRSIGDKIEIYLSVHSYSQVLLVPFGNSTAAYANYYDAVKIGRLAMGALSVRYGTQYTTGNIAEVLYKATGGSDEWVKEHIKVPLVYCYELRDTGTHGFLLPEDQILPNNQEIMDSVLEMIHQAKRMGYMNSGNTMHLSIFLSSLAILFKLML